MEGLEEVLIVFFSWVRMVIEVLGALVVVAGVAVVVGHIVQARRHGRERESGFRHLRLLMSQYLALALEFLLASDILATSMAPSWSDIGGLAAIAAIRTGLNYFLEREVREMEEQGLEPPRRPFEFARTPAEETTETDEAQEFVDGRSPA